MHNIFLMEEMENASSLCTTVAAGCLLQNELFWKELQLEEIQKQYNVFQRGIKDNKRISKAAAMQILEESIHSRINSKLQ